MGTYPEKTPEQARKSLVIWFALPLKDVRGWGPDGIVSRKFLFYLTSLIGAILETVLENTYYVNFLGSNRKNK